MGGEIVPFPAPVVRLSVQSARPAADARPLLAVEHDGAVFSLAALLARLPDTVLDELDGMVPRSAQETWDLVVRRWPNLAKAAVGVNSTRLR